MKRRILSWVMTAAMVITLLPASALAEGGCTHEHDEACGYAAPVAGVACSHEHTAECFVTETNCIHEHDEACVVSELNCTDEHEHTADCYIQKDNCPHICSEETGCVKETLDCKHEHDGDCGYVEAQEGTPCNHEHDEDCGGLTQQEEPTAAELMQDRIDALPTEDALKDMDGEKLEKVYDEVKAIAAAVEEMDREDLKLDRLTALQAFFAAMLGSNGE